MRSNVVRRAKQGASYQVKDLLFQSKRGLKRLADGFATAVA